MTKLDSGHEEEDWRIWLVDTGPETMTGGRLKRLTPYIDQSGSELFLATYGDGVCDVNIAALLDFHYSHGKLATMTAVRPSSRFGELIIEGNLVTQFQEKPQTAEGWINGGYFVLNRKVLDLIEGDATTFEAQPLRTLAALGELAVYKHEGFWQCMDTYREMEMLNQKELLCLLQLASPILPVGGYSYSEGLETLVEKGIISNSASLNDWLERSLCQGSIRLETAVLVRVYRCFCQEDFTKLNYCGIMNNPF